MSRERDESHEHTLTWIAAGTAVGLIAGAVVAERLSGRPITFGALVARGKLLAERASARWEPLVEAAMGVRDAWEGNGEADDAEFEEEEEEFDEDLDEDLDDELDEEEDLDEDDLDEDDLDEDDLDEDDLDDNEDDENIDALDDEAPADDEADLVAVSTVDERVLEAFSNDPILAAREVEIEGTDEDAIILHGRVHTAREVAHAVTIARGVPGVTGVRQRLSVRDRR